MKQSTRFLLSATAVMPSVYGQMLMNQGTDQVCLDPVHTIVYEYPAYFSSVFQTAGTINNFFGGTNSLIINDVPQTVITSTILTTTLITTATKTATATGGPSIAPGTPITLGAGMASGLVTSIPSDHPIKLAYLVDATSNRRPKGWVTDNGTDSNVDAGEEFYLQDGELRTLSNANLGRNSADTFATIIPTTDDMDITGNFTFFDGILRWDSPDRGAAVFYECAATLYAGFTDAPFPNCTVAVIGGVTVDAILASKKGSVTTSSTSTSLASSSTMSSSSSSSMSGSMSSSSSSSGSGSSSTSTSSTSSSTSSSSSSSSTTSSTSSTLSGSSISTSSMTRSSTLTGTTTTSSTSSTTSDDGSDSTTSDISTSTSDDTSSTLTSPTPTPTADLCAEGTYDGFDIQCGSASSGLQDISDTQEDSFQACVDLCSMTDGCLSLDFKIAPFGGFCYLHSARASDAQISVNTEYNHAQLPAENDGGSSSSTTTSSLIVLPTTPSVVVLPTSSIIVLPTSSIVVLPTSSIVVLPTSSIVVLPTSSIVVLPTSSVVVLPTSPVVVLPTSSVVVLPTSSIVVLPTSSIVVLPTSSIVVLPTSSIVVLPTSSVVVLPTPPGIGLGGAGTTTTTAPVAAPTPAGVTQAAPAGTVDGAKACTAAQCPLANEGATFIVNSGIYYAYWKGPNQGLSAVNLIGAEFQHFGSFDECLTACATTKSTNGDPCISVSYSTPDGTCYFHQQCRDTTQANDGVNSQTNFMSAEKMPFNCM